MIQTPCIVDAGERLREGLPPLYVMIAYEDQAAYRRALRMLVNTLAGQEDAADVRPLPWHFEETAFLQWRQHALADATRAAIFVVSTSSDDVLPGNVTEWLTECFARRRDVSTAVIALCQPRKDQALAESPVRRFLRHAAEVAGLDFLEAAEPMLAMAH